MLLLEDRVESALFIPSDQTGLARPSGKFYSKAGRGLARPQLQQLSTLVGREDFTIFMTKYGNLAREYIAGRKREHLW